MNGVANRAGAALTARQEALLAYMRARLLETGAPPTIREMAGHFGVQINAVQGQLRSMIRKGAVTRGDKGQARNWMPAVPEGCCPCCGRPLESES